jgi:hypothetical protein
MHIVHVRFISLERKRDNMKKLLMVFFVATTLCGCSQDLKLLKATARKSTGGAAGRAPSLDYSLTLLSRKSSRMLKAEGLWIEGRYFRPFLTSRGRAEFEARDTLSIRVSSPTREEKLSDDAPPRKEQEQQPPPIRYQGAGLLQYKSGSRTKYLVIDRFEALPPNIVP